jgi:hypothetical protein
MSYSPVDPATWDKQSASAFVLGLDIGMHADHSALVLAGLWPFSGSMIGVVDMKRFELGTPLEEVADEAAGLARSNRAMIVVDASNNSAFVALMAARLPQPPANWLTAAAITGALGHAAQPTPMAVSIGLLRAAVPRWTLSKSELIEQVDAEMRMKTLKITTSGAWELLQDELSTLERVVRASGSASFAAPLGKHDDLVMALALSVFGCRRLGRRSNRRSSAPRPRISPMAWT